MVGMRVKKRRRLRSGPVICLAASVLAFCALPTRVYAGGPRYVAGVSYFDSGVLGTPLTWAQGAINYYTDQGDLSPVLPGPSADAFVASAFSQWTSISTAAISATHAGQLAEDVSGSNIAVSNGIISAPADITPSAVNTPVGVVYDTDGSVTNALLGQGAGSAASCFAYAAYGGVDNFATSAQFLHALVVINGVCAQTSSQLPDVQYRLVRVLGNVLGLDWSQVNVNVVTNSPPPTSDDLAGFPVMHALDPTNCVPISLCFPNASQTKMDDQASLSRLYPVTAQNLANFSGKQIFSTTTGRVHGSVYFVDVNGAAAQPMQGVNVVARWIDPSTGQPSGTYALASVSGFLFIGNGGNPATGFNDPNGQPFNQFGSNDPTDEGFFDLAGLQIPNGASSAQYQLSVEALDPIWSQAVGPYGPLQVAPSGVFQPVVVTVTAGNDVEQDILMQGSSIQTPDFFGPTSYASPAALPTAADWTVALGSYGASDYFYFPAQNNRTLTVEVTALDETGTASETKAQPVIGMWALADPGTFPAPANTPSAFNSLNFGMTQLDAQILASTSFRLGIFDYRGDGRPDYHYHARVFYGDNLSPVRASVAGGTGLTVQGMGFQPNTAATVGSVNANVLSVSSNQVILNGPAMADGLQDLSLSDPATHASSVMSGVLTYGAGPNDKIILIEGGNPATPVGGQAPNPIRVQVVAQDGVTPVNGASVVFTATPAVSFSACNGAGSCTVLTDSSGSAATFVTVLTTGVMNLTAELAPASYQPPQTVQATLLGTSSASDVALVPQFAWIAQGATVTVPLTARLLSNGAPKSGSSANFKVVKGSGALSASSVATDVNGYARTSLLLTALGGDVQVSACAAPNNQPCQIFSGTAVPASALRLQAVAGGQQAIAATQIFQPVIARVTDASSPPNPVLGATVIFQAVVSRLAPPSAPITIGGIIVTRSPAPIIISSSQGSLISDLNGLATLQPSTGGASGAIQVQGDMAAGTNSLPFLLQWFGIEGPVSHVRPPAAYPRGDRPE